ncbi:sarcosine oxidase, subunit beta [Burkholderiales bacterium]|nr:sarcosine oxidase, subunit beta [Burkholderiales bacterium]
MSRVNHHIVIVGGGVIGSAIASFTLRDPAFRGAVTVVERDPTYARASSALSASSIRQQFSTAINVEIGRFGIEFLRRAGEHLATAGERPDIGLVEPGYLFLARAAGAGVLERNHALQRSLGVDVALLDPPALRERCPWLATGDIAKASLGLSGEGWFDGWTLLQAFRRHARSLGARYVAAEAAGFDVNAGRVAAVRLADGSRIAGDTFVDAAGPWAANVARWLGVDLPVRARRRCVFVFSCRTPIPRCPLVVDTSGAWFRPEGDGQFLCGIAPDESNDPDDAPLDVDHALFDEVLWPALAARVPAFEAIRQTRSWAGYYEYNTFDRNGIVGAHPEWANLVFANGFSGHGIQESPAVGRGVAELVVHGGYRTLDLSPLAFDRVARNEPVEELNVV